MKLSDIGEFAFIDHFASMFSGGLQQGILGIGDDCAVLPLGDQKVGLVTTDMLIEDSHFLRNHIPPEDLGYKSLAVNLSDIAAMGGKPLYAFLSLGLPADVEVSWMDMFFTGMHDLCRETGVQLLGGDTTKSPNNLIVNLLVIGEAAAEAVKFRSSAKTGDLICVTDNLGDSGAGLRLILENKIITAEEDILVNRHYRPRAHLEEGLLLAGFPGVHAMMDVSDGIDSDLHRIMEKSGCGARVAIRQLPCSESLREACDQHRWDMHELAATGGEDYCLLCTVDPKAYPSISGAFSSAFRRELTVIGEITARRGLHYYDGKKKIKLTGHGFDHFA